MPILADNCAWIVRLPGGVAVVDPGEPGPVLAAARARDWRIAAVFLTHHHGDHTGGAADLRRETGARIFGPRADGIDFVDEDLGLGARDLFGAPARIFEVPGHTRHHIAIHFPGGVGTNAPAEPHLFVGDILFVAGCGRLFEGPPGPFFEAIQREILPLSDATVLFPGHDYAQKNLPFAEKIEPENPQIARRIGEARRAAAENRPYLPTRLSEERATNPFLRAADAAAFARLRAARDVF